jgi:hypothetical protein
LEPVDERRRVNRGVDPLSVLLPGKAQQRDPQPPLIFGVAEIDRPSGAGDDADFLRRQCDAK